MRYLEMKTIIGDGVNFKYRDQLLQVARFPSSERGVTITEMETALPVIQKLRDATDGDVIELENAEYDYLFNKLQTWQFNQTHASVSDFLAGLQERLQG